MKLHDLTEPELKALDCMFHDVTGEWAARICGCTIGRVGYLRRSAFKKMGWSSVVEAVRALCKAGWNDEQTEESYGTREDITARC